jgi:endonuclease V-like protein UPF0215 family
LSLLSIVGVEDGSFKAFQPDQKTLLCAVKMIGDRISDVRLRKISVDGTDATTVLLEMLFNLQCDLVILGGISFAGFNVVNAFKVNNEIGKPIIIYSSEMPNSDSVKSALMTHFHDWLDRWSSIEDLGKVYQVMTKFNSSKIFYEVVGASPDWAKKVLEISAYLSRTPEPVRIAGLIARGLSKTA